jgi:hypothetical protein
MNGPTSKSSLSDPQHRLIELMQSLNFGRIEALRIHGGQPVFEPAPRVIQKLKMGGENGPRPEAGLQDFWLKQQTVEMLRAIAELGDGVVSVIEVKHGLPYAVEIERQPGQVGGCADA